MRLFELAMQHKALQDTLESMDVDEQTINDTLEAASGPLEEKLINAAMVLRNIQAEESAIAAEIERLQFKKDAKTVRAASLKRYMHESMKTAGISKLDTPLMTIAIKKNPPAVIVDDESAIPADYFEQIPASQRLSRKLIASAIKDGFTVPGAHLEQGTSLIIK